jgi:hypothetical protein
MSRLSLLAAGALGIVSLSLVGSGAYAWSSTSHHHHPQGSVGNVVLSAANATGNDTRSVTLGAVGPVGSSFTSGLTPVTITNAGTAPAALLTLGVTGGATTPAFGAQTWACVVLEGRELANQPLDVVEGYGPARVPWLTIAPQGTATFAVVLYAGASEATGCGAAMSDFHAGHWGSSQHKGYGYGVAYPSGATNPAASSLNNSAEGGMLQLTVTTTYAVGHDHDHRCRQWQDAAKPREEHDCR